MLVPHRAREMITAWCRWEATSTCLEAQVRREVALLTITWVERIVPRAAGARAA